MSDSNYHPPTSNEAVDDDAVTQRAWNNYAASVDPQKPISAYDLDEHAEDTDIVIYARHARKEVEPDPAPTWPRPA